MSQTGFDPLRVLAWPAYYDPDENPYNTQLYSHLSKVRVETDEWSPGRLRRGGYHIFHLHWPDLELQEVGAIRAARRASRLVAYLLIARARGMRVVWTVHNLSSHERWHPLLEEVMWWCLTRLIHAHISLTAAAQTAAHRRFPVLRRVPGFVVAHGHFRDVLPRSVTREEARRRLAIPQGSVMVVFFGLIRAYKNVDLLVRTFRALRDDRLLLLVAGRPEPMSIGDQVASSAAGDPRIRLRLEFIPPAEVSVVLMAADLVVLPYRDILNSGTAILALSFGRPVLVPALGSLPDLQAAVGSSYVRTYSGPLTADILAQAIASLDPAATSAPPDLSSLDWPAIAEQTLRAYRAVLAS
jgi:glycosyltransferase involved in cell wall biosynthesis